MKIAPLKKEHSHVTILCKHFMYDVRESIINEDCRSNRTQMKVFLSFSKKPH